MVGLGNFECDRDLAGWFSARKVQNVRRDEAHGRSFASFSAQKFFQTQPRDLALLLRGNADLGGRGIVEALFEKCKHLLSAFPVAPTKKNVPKRSLFFLFSLAQPSAHPGPPFPLPRLSFTAPLTLL